MKTMDNAEILETHFHQAVSAIDAGDVTTLGHLMAAHPRLVRDRLDAPGAWLRDAVGGASTVSSRNPTCSGSLPRIRSAMASCPETSSR